MHNVTYRCSACRKLWSAIAENDSPVDCISCGAPGATALLTTRAADNLLWDISMPTGCAAAPQHVCTVEAATMGELVDGIVRWFESRGRTNFGYLLATNRKTTLRIQVGAVTAVSRDFADDAPVRVV